MDIYRVSDNPLRILCKNIPCVIIPDRTTNIGFRCYDFDGNIYGTSDPKISNLITNLPFILDPHTLEVTLYSAITVWISNNELNIDFKR